MDGTGTQRLSQKDKCHQDSIGGILEEVETFSRGVLKSVQAVAGTTNCKGVQISRIAEWANKNGYWIETVKLGSYEDRGSENEGNISTYYSQSPKFLK